MTRLASIVFFSLALFAAGTWYFVSQEPAVFSAKAVAEVSGTVKFIRPGPNSEPPSQTAIVELPDGTKVEAAVPGGCIVIVGQTASLSVFQPVKLGPKVYVVASSASQ